MEDERIIALYFERSESAIEETSRKYGGLCFEVADSILRSRADSEECVSDTYLSVWNAIPPTKPLSLRAFVLKITRNISMSRLRKNLAQKRTSGLEVSLDELEDILPDERIAPDFEPSDVGAVISEFLMKCDPDARNIFIRKYWFFDTVEEISRRYGFGESKIKTSLHRTRERLRVYLTERGVRV